MELETLPGGKAVPGETQPGIATTRAKPGTRVDRASVGMFFDAQPEITGQDVVFGAEVATRGFVEAFLQHGHADACELFASPSWAQTTAAAVSRHIGSRGTAIPSVRVQSYGLLLDRFAEQGVTTWHDPGARFQRAYHLRRIRANSPYPVTFTHHTISYQDMLHQWVLPLLLNDTLPCDSVVCTSKAARRALETLMSHVREQFAGEFGCRREYRGRLDVIPLGVDVQLFRPREKEDVRHHLGLPHQALILLWFGRFSAMDKMDLLPLLRVMARLAAEPSERPLLLVLAGTERESYASVVAEYARSLEIQSRVRILRNFPVSNRHLLFSAADIFVSPADNIQETFGLTPIEAMASGVPQVVADWDGYRDTVAHGQTGFRVPTYWASCSGDLEETAALFHYDYDHLRLAQSVVVDTDAMHAALRELISNPELREEMSRRSRARAVALFSWHSVIGQYEALWKELRDSAAGLSLPAGPAGRYTFPPYWQAFGHYASAEIHPEQRLAVTEAGARVLAAREAPPSYSAVLETLDGELVTHALSAVKLAGSLRGEYTLRNLVDDLGETHAYPADRIRRHVLWLLKCDLLCASGGFPTPASLRLPGGEHGIQ